MHVLYCSCSLISAAATSWFPIRFSGNVTLRLQNVPWDQAMDIVLATKGLDMRENGNVIIVAPAAEIAAREKADFEARKEIKTA